MLLDYYDVLNHCLGGSSKPTSIYDNPLHKKKWVVALLA